MEAVVNTAASHFNGLVSREAEHRISSSTRFFDYDSLKLDG